MSNRARGENTDEPSGLHTTYLEADRAISTFSFDPNSQLGPKNPHRGGICWKVG